MSDHFGAITTRYARDVAMGQSENTTVLIFITPNLISVEQAPRYEDASRRPSFSDRNHSPSYITYIKHHFSAPTVLQGKASNKCFPASFAWVVLPPTIAVAGHKVRREALGCGTQRRRWRRRQWERGRKLASGGREGAATCGASLTGRVRVGSWLRHRHSWGR